MRSSGYSEVVTVPDSATNGWVLRSYVTGCGDPILRINNDDPVTMDREAVLLVKAGETLQRPVLGHERDRDGRLFHVR